MSLTRVSQSMIGYNGVTSITTNTTITEDLYIGSGQIFNVSGGATLTFSGAFDAGLYQIFTGTGEVKFDIGSVSRVCPEWWGAVNDGVADCAPAINSAIRSGTLCNGIPVHLNSGGTYGLGSPIFITSIGVTLIGATPVYSTIGPLAVDISVGGGSNAMIVNKVQPTNCKIQNIRFSENGLNFNGWCISGNVGEPDTELNFSSLYIQECWIALSAAASQGFFRGGFVDAHFEANQFEFTKGSCFKLGDAVGGFWLDNAVSQTSFGTFINATTKATGSNTVKGLIAQDNKSDFLIKLSNATNWHISDITVIQNPYLPGVGGYYPGILSVDTCTNIIFTNFTSITAGNASKGIEIAASQIIISNGQVITDDVMVINHNPFNISGVDNDIIIDNIFVSGVGNNLRGQITIADNTAGHLRVNNSTFDKSAASFLVTGATAVSLNFEFNGNRITNCNYNGPSLHQMFDVVTSGYTRILNNVIGVTDILSTPVSIYRFLGAGDLIQGGNTILGLGGGSEVATGSVKTPSYIGANFNGASYRTDAATPVGAVAPLFLGEMFYQSTGDKWFKSYGLTNTSWTILN